MLSWEPSRSSVITLTMNLSFLFSVALGFIPIYRTRFSSRRRGCQRVGNSFYHPKVGWVKDMIKRKLEGWNPLMRKRMLVREIPRKRFLLHLPCLWTSMRKKDYLRYIEELRRRPELSPLRSGQASVSDSPRSQPINSLSVITLRVMISVELGNRHCRV
ncbi:hypothetical protein PIB30_086044 [Stylosanthes scabra]|uniref:Uncharacterized protein n=1 Tax=Stylosanthes scabra TaxID=79078 RepID=A0ABU6WT02_9FABA|nr:hypothetical protein [Stylosanthes scabra]